MVCMYVSVMLSVWFCAVSVSRVYVVCYSTHHRVMSQARDDYEGFLKAHETEDDCEQKEVSCFVTHALTLPPTHSLTQSLYHALTLPRTHARAHSLLLPGVTRAPIFQPNHKNFCTHVCVREYVRT